MICLIVGQILFKDFFELNFDGSYVHATDFASCGAVFHNSDGKFIQAFSKRLDHCHILETHLQVIFYAMKMTLYLKVDTLIVESDCLEAIQLLDGVDH